MKRLFFNLFTLTSAFICFSCSSMVEDLKNISSGTNAKYVIENRFEAVNTDDYDSALTKISEPAEGIVEKVDAENFEGFYLDKKVIEDNTSYSDASVKKVIKFYFKRNRVTLSFDPDGGYIDASSAVLKISGKYGEAVTVSAGTPIRTDYEFTGWYKAADAEKNAVAVPATFPAESLSLKAAWHQSYARYTVNYEYEKLDGTTYETKFSEEKGGEPGSAVEVSDAEIDAREAEGFEYSCSEPADLSSAAIASDNSTVVKIKYTRKSYTLTLNPNEGTWSDSSTGNKEISVKYGSSLSGLSIEEPARGSGDDAWGFVKWYVEGDEASYMPETMPAEDVTLAAKWARPYAPYTVEYWFEKLASEGEYEIKSALTQTLKAGVGEMTEAQPLAADKVPSGYSYKTTEQTTVLEDGTSVAKVYYDRSVVTVKFETNGGFWDGADGTDSEAITFTGKWGIAFTKPDVSKLSKPLYKLAGWYKNGSGSVLSFNEDISSNIPVENVTYVAAWERSGVLYAVNFWFEKVDAAYPSSLDEDNYEMNGTKVLSGEYGESTKSHSVISTVEGFTALDTAEKTIADGSDDLAAENQVDVYYQRNLVTFTFNPNDGVTQNIEVPKKYGYKVLESDIPVLTRTDYEFSSWTAAGSSIELTTAELIEKYPTFKKDTTFTAQWNFVGTDYTVDYLFEALDGSYAEDDALVSKYSLKKTRNGQNGTTTNVSSQDIPGYETPVITQITIGSGDAVKVKYARKTVSLQFDVNGGSWTGDSVKTVSGKYGATVDYSLISTSPTKSFADFVGWYVSSDSKQTAVALPETFPASGVIYKAKWKDLDTATVNGEGEQAGQEIALTASGTGSTRTFTATVPYDTAADWTFVWRLDGTVLSTDDVTFTNNEKTQSFTKEFTVTGNHKVEVFAYETSALVLSKSVSVTIE